jgi:hypothetical protein
VRTADCLPVALFSSSAAGVIHAGWRGLASGVLESGLEAMRSAGDVRAATRQAMRYMRRSRKWARVPGQGRTPISPGSPRSACLRPG